MCVCVCPVEIGMKVKSLYEPVIMIEGVLYPSINIQSEHKNNVKALCGENVEDQR